MYNETHETIVKISARMKESLTTSYVDTAEIVGKTCRAKVCGGFNSVCLYANGAPKKRICVCSHYVTPHPQNYKTVLALTATLNLLWNKYRLYTDESILVENKSKICKDMESVLESMKTQKVIV